MAVNSYVEAGLPNIKGTFSADQWVYYGLRYSGAFKFTGWIGAGDAGTGGNDHALFTFDASSYNNIYNDEVNTVQPASYTVYYIIKIK